MVTTRSAHPSAASVTQPERHLAASDALTPQQKARAIKHAVEQFSAVPMYDGVDPVLLKSSGEITGSDAGLPAAVKRRFSALRSATTDADLVGVFAFKVPGTKQTAYAVRSDVGADDILSRRGRFDLELFDAKGRAFARTTTPSGEASMYTVPFDFGPVGQFTRGLENARSAQSEKGVAIAPREARRALEALVDPKTGKVKPGIRKAALERAGLARYAGSDGFTPAALAAVKKALSPK